MPNMKLTALQIPTLGSAGFIAFNFPQMDQALLHQILLQHRISANPGYDAAQRLLQERIVEERN
jgi:hypothetical protein